MERITWADFERVELRVGTIVEVGEFPEARNPAWKLTVDFGPLSTRLSSAQITALYPRDELVGRQVLAVLNFPDRGVVAILDRRVQTKSYGRVFLDSLTKCTMKRGGLRQLPQEVVNWLGD